MKKLNRQSKIKKKSKKEEEPIYKIDWITIIIVIIALLIILLFGIPDKNYYPGKPWWRW